MRILALETAIAPGSVALLDAGRYAGQINLPADSQMARSLTPAIDRLLRDAGWQPSDIQLVAVSIGPGSFTGLRIGVTTAKTFAYAVGADVVAVDTLEAIAWQAPRWPGRLMAVIDAHRQQLFVGQFEQPGGQPPQPLGHPHVEAIDSWLRRLEPATIVMGPGLRKVVDRLPSHVNVVPHQLWQPRAETVGTIAWRAYRAGRRDDLWSLAPQYLRKSAAEEKLGDR